MNTGDRQDFGYGYSNYDGFGNIYQPYAPIGTGSLQQLNQYIPPVPTVCRGNVHVFPCKRCGECECGQAALTLLGKP